LAQLISGSSNEAMKSAGAALPAACRQSEAGIGQGMPWGMSGQSGQWLHGAFVAPCSGIDVPIGAPAATVARLLARIAKQAKVAARIRKRITKR